MKKWIFCASLVLACVSCNNHNTFTVGGTVSGAEGKVLYLENLAAEKPAILDSVILKSDGNFSFKGKRPQYPEFYRLRLDNAYIHLAVDSTENINIKTSLPDFGFNYEVTGSDECEKMRIVSQESVKLRTRINEVTEAMKSDKANADSLRALALADIDAYKKRMIDIVLENPRAAAAYYIIFQRINNEVVFDVYDPSDCRIIAAVATAFDSFYPDAPRTRQLHDITISGLQAIKKNKESRQNVNDNIREVETASFIDIALNDIYGHERRLSSIAGKGKVVLLDFTAYKTEYSPAYNIRLAELYRKYASRGFEIYQISLDAEENFWKVSADNLPWICVWDPASVYSSIANTYNVKELPTSYLLDRDGELVKRLSSPWELESLLEKYL